MIFKIHLNLLDSFLFAKKTNLNILIYVMNILAHNVFRRQQKTLKSLNVHQKDRRRIV